MSLFNVKMQFEKRDKLPLHTKVLIPTVFILASLSVCAILIASLGFEPFKVYLKLMKGAFGSWNSFAKSVLQAIPMMICGLGVSLSFKMSINNIGGEGQFTIGAMVATGIALYCPWIPTNLVIPAMFIGGFIGGAVWGAISIAPKALWNVNETIVTLMFNYIGILFVQYLVFGPWKDNSGSNLAMSREIPEFAKLKTYFGTGIHSGLFYALILAVGIFIFFKYTTAGYQISVIGANKRAAKFAGMDIVKKMFLVMIISGGIAGISGMAQISGVVGRLEESIANGVGFTAIIIAFLSKQNPFVIVVVSILFGGLVVGGYSLQIMGVPAQIVTLIQGAILFFVVGGDIFTNYKFTFSKKEELV